MAVSGDELEMLMDSRLSADARVLGAFIAGKGPGMHEIPRDQFLPVLGADAGKGRVQRALHQLEHFAWIARTEGGRGHADAFAFRGRENETLSGPEPASPEEFRSRVRPPLNVENQDRGRVSPPLKPTVVVDRMEEEKPPVVPLRFPFSAKAAELFVTHATKLTGCRGSYRDYMEARVRPDRQGEHIYTVLSWLGDSPASPLRSIPPPERPALLAMAFNELLADGERGAEKPMKYPDGDTKNLRTKLNILVQQWGSNGRRNDTVGASRQTGGIGTNPVRPAGKYSHLVEGGAAADPAA